MAWKLIDDGRDSMSKVHQLELEVALDCCQCGQNLWPIRCHASKFAVIISTVQNTSCYNKVPGISIRQQSERYHRHQHAASRTSHSPMSAGSTVLEEQPLLSSSKPPSYHDSSLESRIPDEEAVILIDEDDISNSPKEPWTRTQITVYGVLTLLGLFILAIFIKGFIDADDVEV
ncbi:hypothetical protein M405DRAFT_527282 [Rhizopogon salebrosus TDB-379]|nr:hypothetical protein M405DRAFT_527282 [Rhizopogon salebrosus TDB-379]